MAENRGKPRGELAELSAQLQNLCTAGKRTERELRNAKKDVFKKVINYMTLGMDMSALFPMMTSCANLSSDDLVLKKMLYLYLTHYASQTPDLALLTINQLQKDCADHDPMIRGLALRSLCSLRVANFLEYVVTPIMTGLSDRHPYVRRTAVMGVLKVHHIDPTTVAQQGMVERVKRLLSADSDVQVIANCLSVLMQLEPPSRLVERAFLYSLLNRIKEFSDWGQCQVLELASHYPPSGEAEVYDLLNALEDRMGHTNSAVVLATIKVFLRLTINMTATHQQVLERIREPLKTLISRDDAATAYAALSHVLLLAQRAPMIFENDATAFFCRTHDPWFVKKLKLEILAAIANSSNVYDIVTELTEYARDISPTMAREAVRAVGRIALAVPDSGGIIERLLLFLDAGNAGGSSGSEHLVSEALVQLADVVRRYPDTAHVVVGALGDLGVYGNITEPAARASYVWLIGQFGALVPEAPYILEPFVEGFAAEEPAVRLALLTSAVQLFFRRPPEARGLLGAALAAGVADEHMDVRDRALMYYRLLRADAAAAERVIAPPLLVVPWFSEALSPEARDAVFEEFNSLSVVFQQPSGAFIERQAYHSLESEPEPPAPAATTGDLLALEAPELVNAQRATNLLADADMDGGAGGAGGSGRDTPSAAAAAAALGSDLLDLSLGPDVAALPGASGSMGPGGMYGGPMPHPSPAYTVLPPTPQPPQIGSLQQQQPGQQQQQWDMLGSLMGPPPPLPPPQQQQQQHQLQPLPQQWGGAPPVQGLPPHQQQQHHMMMAGGVGAAAAPPASGAGVGGVAMPLPGGMAMFGGGAGGGRAAAAAGPGAGVGELLGLLDEGPMMRGPGGGMTMVGQQQPQQPQPQQQQPAHAAPVQELVLNSKARMTPGSFQDEWRRLSPAHSASLTVSAASVASLTANNHRDFTQHMAQANIHTIASGGQPPNFRYYFYGQQQQSPAAAAAPSSAASLFLVELLLRGVGAAGGSLTVTVKTTDAARLPAFLEIWNACLAGYLG